MVIADVVVAAVCGLRGGTHVGLNAHAWRVVMAMAMVMAIRRERSLAEAMAAGWATILAPLCEDKQW